MCKCISGHQAGSDWNTHGTQVDCTDRRSESSSKMKQQKKPCTSSIVPLLSTKATLPESVRQARSVSELFPWQAGERQCSEGMLG